MHFNWPLAKDYDEQIGEQGFENQEDQDMEVEEGVAILDERTAANDATANGVELTPIEKKDRTTTPYMTKYERARVLGTRALQIRYNKKREGGKHETCSF